MRNLLQYPITLEERIEVLADLRDSILAENRVGDIRPLVLSQMIVALTEKPVAWRYREIGSSIWHYRPEQPPEPSPNDEIDPLFLGMFRNV